MCSNMCTFVVAIVAVQVEFLNSYSYLHSKNSAPILYPVFIVSIEPTFSKYSLKVPITGKNRPQIYNNDSNVIYYCRLWSVFWLNLHKIFGLAISSKTDTWTE